MNDVAFCALIICGLIVPWIILVISFLVICVSGVIFVLSRRQLVFD